MLEQSDRAAHLRGIADLLERLPDRRERAGELNTHADKTWGAAAGRLIYEAVEDAGAFDYPFIVQDEAGESRSYNYLREHIQVCGKPRNGGDNDFFYTVWIYVTQDWLPSQSKTIAPHSTGSPDPLYIFRDYCRQMANVFRRESRRIEEEVEAPVEQSNDEQPRASPVPVIQEQPTKSEPEPPVSQIPPQQGEGEQPSPTDALSPATFFCPDNANLVSPKTVDAIRLQLPGWDGNKIAAYAWLVNHDWPIDRVDRMTEEEVYQSFATREPLVQFHTNTPHIDYLDLSPKNDDPPEARAIALAISRPGLTDVEIAAKIGVNRSTLYTWPNYTTIRQGMREAAKGKIPRGSKSKDGGMEAVDD